MSSRNMNTLTSREVNHMILRYLQDSGFKTSAFNLQNEASIDKESNADLYSPSAVDLATLVMKGHEYLEMEANLNTVNTDAGEGFVFVKPFDLLNKKDKAAVELEKQSKGKEKEDQQIENKQEKVKRKLKKRVSFKDMDISTSSIPQGVRSPDSLVLEGHSAEVWTCAWSPAGSLLASGSDDATARIWSIADRTDSSSGLKSKLAGAHVLKHAKQNGQKKRITTLHWNLDGTLLATGSYDGLARIWNTNGELMSKLSKHKGPILSVKWNKKGDHLLTGSRDRSVIVWDVNANKWKQQFEFHTGPTVDVDWRTNYTFASGSSDSMICVCKIGESQPVKMFSGHKDEVNHVKWDPNGSLLASCSDDKTVKIWSMMQDKPIYDFKDHAEAIYTIRWSPVGSATNNQLLLASASYDSTVKLWDVESGRLLRSLNKHKAVVYGISFSPDGKHLASGSEDKVVYIWSVKDGKIVKEFDANAGICEVCWNKEGNKIAYSTQDKNVYVSDLRM